MYIYVPCPIGCIVIFEIKIYTDFCYDFIGSPEPKAQGELLVSKGDAAASVVRCHASTIVFFSETTGQIYFKFGL
jgi:hypothetical protein